MIKNWLSIIVVLTLLTGLSYFFVQQSLRMGANDPQIEVAEDIADYLAQGADVQSLIPNNKVDVAKSLSPFVIVYDDTGKAVFSTGYLNNQIPVLPQGVLDYTKRNNQDRLTWEPQKNVRIAAVVNRFSGKMNGYVLAGRSLREVEKLEDKFTQSAVFTWVIGSALVTLLFFAPGRKQFLGKTVSEAQI